MTYVKLVNRIAAQERPFQKGLLNEREVMSFSDSSRHEDAFTDTELYDTLDGMKSEIKHVIRYFTIKITFDIYFNISKTCIF